MWLRTTVFLTFYAVAGQAGAQIQQPDATGKYLCNITAIAGINKAAQNEKWQSVRVNPDGAAYVFDVKKTNDSTIDHYKIKVKEVREKAFEYDCLDRNTSKDAIFLRRDGFQCTTLSEDFWLNIRDRRIMVFFEGSYINESIIGNKRMASIEVGTCTKID